MGRPVLVPRRDELPQTRREWSADLVAGVTVGVVALPLAMGFGLASGVGAASGLVTAIVAGIVAALFGGSNLQVSGPTGAMTVVLVPVIAAHGVSAVPVLAVMAGLIVLVAGWLGLGTSVTLIPWPVVEGFTVGIATIIFLQQIPVLLDVERGPSTNTVVATIDVLRRTRWSDSLSMLAVGLGVVVLVLACRRLAPRAPGTLLAVVVATVAVAALDLTVPTIGVVHLGSIVHAPDVPGVGELGRLLPSALVIALLAALESLLSARVADGMGDVAATDPDRELQGQGLANVASGLMGGLPATGAIARTAVNVRAGARTRMAAVLHGLLLLVVLVGAARLLALVPLAAIAAILMVTAVHMVDVRTVRALVRADRSSAAVLVITAATTLLFDLARAVEVGVLVAAVLVLRHSARASGIEEESLDGHVDDRQLRQLLREHVVVYRLQGALFFGAAQQFLEELTNLDRTRVIVLRLGGLHLLDVSGAQVLAEAIDRFQEREIAVLLCGVRPRHHGVLGAVGIPGERLTPDRMFDNLPTALDEARRLAVGA